MSNHMNRAAGRGAKSRLYPQPCALALGVAMVLAGASANAQDSNAKAGSDPAVELEAVQVTGLRGSLMRAQDLKQDAEQIIDSVTAQDIGALPDRSVTETLKRVSGVTVTGFAARDDTDHFSAEGSGVMIRGLTFVRGELNGRDVFSANGGRGLSFEEIPAELMAGVDVYKNPSAEIIEGGLGGTVNLRTRKPFDEPGRKIAGSVDYNYGDKAKDARPSASFLFSDRWQTGIGEVGFLAGHGQAPRWRGAILRTIACAGAMGCKVSSIGRRRIAGEGPERARRMRKARFSGICLEMKFPIRTIPGTYRIVQ